MKVSTGHKNAVADALQTAYDYGVMHIYSGAKPASSDDAETGTLLAVITESGGAFTPGVQTNGLRFGEPSNGVIGILAGQVWKTNSVLVTGVAGWGRFYANARTLGASSSAVRFDFTIGVTGADLILPTTNVYAGTPFTINNFTITAR